ncbi:MAG: hypothetical protein RQ746_16030 [Bacteroidales bacterium]|nr:hypothetical protein [Bacteroidales bacterium]
MKPKMRITTRLILIFLLSTVFLALSWQSDATAFFIFVTFVPVFFLLNNPRLTTHDKPLLWILTFLSVFLTAYVGVYWIRNVNPTTHFVIALLRAFTMLLPYAAAYLYLFSGKSARTSRFGNTATNTGVTNGNSTDRISDHTDPASESTGRSTTSPIMVFMAAWMIMEVLHDLNILGMSYGNLGHVLAAYPGIIQWYSVTGNLGGTLWILLVNFALFLLLRPWLTKTQRTSGNFVYEGRSGVDPDAGMVPEADPASLTGKLTGRHEPGNDPVHDTGRPGPTLQIRKMNRAALFALAATLPLIISLIMFRSPADTTKTGINVIALHTSMDVYDYKYEVNPDELLEASISSTKNYLDSSTTNIVFWPENAIMGDLFLDSLNSSHVVQRIRNELLNEKVPLDFSEMLEVEEKGMEEKGMEEKGMEEKGMEEMMELKGKRAEKLETTGPEEKEAPGTKPNVILVTGAIVDQITPPPPPDSYQPQILYNAEKNYHFKRYNTALLIISDATPRVKFKKRLVPMSEQVPKQKLFAPLVRLVPNLEDLNFSPAGEGYPVFDFGTIEITSASNSPIKKNSHISQDTNTTQSDLTHPDSRNTLDIQTSPIICYGSAFSTFTAKEVLQTNSSFLAILLNEGWMKSNTAYRHFNWFATCRAIENRRFVVKSSNEGITTLIDSKGTSKEQLSGTTSGAVTGDLEVNETLTFYTKYHPYIAWGILISGILTILVILLRISKNRKANHLYA